MRKRVLVASIVHETHTFVRRTTELTDFRIWQEEEMWQAEGDASILAGILEVGRACDWEILPVIEMCATPGGMVSDSAVNLFLETFRAVAERELPRGIDGILLNMHGAMVSQSHLDAEGEILRQVRAIPGLEATPLCGPLDLHGNFTPTMAHYANGFTAYRENPHTDVKETGKRASHLLDRLMRTQERAVMVYEHPPLVFPPTGTGTADEPMRSLEARAREIEAECPEILAVSIFAGFSFADIPETGVSFIAVTVGDPAVAQEYLRSLSVLALSMKEKGVRKGLPLEEVMERLKTHIDAPTLLVEPSDNIGGGASGDLTIVLKALLENEIQNSAVALHDPEAVELLWGKAVGERVTTAIGGKSGEMGAEPLILEVEMVSQSDGSYDLVDRHSHGAGQGLRQEMGRCVVVRCQGVTILLTSKRTPPFDLGQWYSQGILPETLSVIGVKAAVAHRQAYNPITKASYTLDTPGPCAENLQRFTFRHILRPIYPLDNIDA